MNSSLWYSPSGSESLRICDVCLSSPNTWTCSFCEGEHFGWRFHGSRDDDNDALWTNRAPSLRCHFITASRPRG